MKHAFYLSPDLWADAPVLTGEEFEHVRVLRLKTSERILLLDGKGRKAVCEIKAVKRKFVELEMLESSYIPEQESRAVMAIALSKAVRRGFFLEKAAELGAWGIWLWQAERSISSVTSEVLESCKNRLIAGAKQSKNPWLPEIGGFKSANELVEASRIADWRILPWEMQENIPMIEACQLGRKGFTVYVIGPEGGFSEREITLFKEADFKLVSLGNRVLRCETAAVLCLGLHFWASQMKRAS